MFFSVWLSVYFGFKVIFLDQSNRSSSRLNYLLVFYHLCFYYIQNTFHLIKYHNRLAPVSYQISNQSIPSLINIFFPSIKIIVFVSGLSTQPKYFTNTNNTRHTILATHHTFSKVFVLPFQIKNQCRNNIAPHRSDTRSSPNSTFTRSRATQSCHWANSPNEPPRNLHNTNEQQSTNKKSSL